jgi:hypothetical protein
LSLINLDVVGVVTSVVHDKNVFVHGGITETVRFRFNLNDERFVRFVMFLCFFIIFLSCFYFFVVQPFSVSYMVIMSKNFVIC